jgi:hypothetical protein
MNFHLGMLMFALPGIIAAQATAETAVGASRAATMTAPAQRAGKAIAGAFDSLNHTLQGQENSNSTTGRTATPSPTHSRTKSGAVKQDSGSGVAQPKVETTNEDPSGIQEGMEYAQVEHRFGPPSLRITTSPGEEMLYYARKSVKVDVTVRDGKVAVVNRSGGVDSTPSEATAK